MEGKDLIIEVIHPLVKDLLDVFREHYHRVCVLKEDEKALTLEAVEEITKILVDALKKDVLQSNRDYIEIGSFLKLIELYLTISFKSINNGE